jgi:hypothetical protein
VPHRLLAAGVWWFPSPRHGEEHGIGKRRTSQITLGVRAARQQRAEPVGDHAEFLAGAQPSAHCTFGCL